MLTGNGSACIRRVSMRLLVLKWQFGFRMWSTLIIGGLLLLWVLRIHCSESLLLSTVLHILLPIVMEILVARLICCGYRHSPRSKFYHTIRLSHFNQKIQNELVSRVGLVHFVFSDCSAYSIARIRRAVHRLVFQLLKVQPIFYINIMLNDQLWKHQHSRCE